MPASLISTPCARRSTTPSRATTRPPCSHAIYPVAHAIAIEDGARFRELVARAARGALARRHRDHLRPRVELPLRRVTARRGRARLLPRRREARSPHRPHRSTPPAPVAVLTAHAGALRTQGRLDDARAKLDEAGRMLDEHRGTELRPAVGAAFARARHRGAAPRAPRQRAPQPRVRARPRRPLTSPVPSTSSASRPSPSRATRSATSRPPTSRIAEVHAADAPEHVMRSGYAAPVYMAEILVATDRHDSSRVDELVDEPRRGRHPHRLGAVRAPSSTPTRSRCRAMPIEALDLLHRRYQGFARWKPAGIGRTSATCCAPTS